MATQAIDAGRRTSVPLRAAPIWIALAVALLSSLIPGGLPRTTILGSAFNPATTAVALQPTRIQPRAPAEHVRQDDDPASGQRAAILPDPISVQPVVRPLTVADAPKPAVVARPIAPRAGLDGNPRGPPSA